MLTHKKLKDFNDMCNNMCLSIQNSIAATSKHSNSVQVMIQSNEPGMGELRDFTKSWIDVNTCQLHIFARWVLWHMQMAAVILVILTRQNSHELFYLNYTVRPMICYGN